MIWLLASLLALSYLKIINFWRNLRITPFRYLLPSSDQARLKNSLLKFLLFHLPRNALYWLDAQPAGLKLNTELSRFYANTFMSVIDTWECGYLILPVVFSSCLIPFFHSHSATHNACSYNYSGNAILVWRTHALTLRPFRPAITPPHSTSPISIWACMWSILGRRRKAWWRFTLGCIPRYMSLSSSSRDAALI